MIRIIGIVIAVYTRRLARVAWQVAPPPPDQRGSQSESVKVWKLTMFAALTARFGGGGAADCAASQAAI